MNRHSEIEFEYYKSVPINAIFYMAIPSIAKKRMFHLDTYCDFYYGIKIKCGMYNAMIFTKLGVYLMHIPLNYTGYYVYYVNSEGV
jgi:hypothetical protein